MKDKLRCWSCYFDYEGKNKTMFSHVVLELDATEDDVRAKLTDVMRYHLPEGFRIVEVLRGRTFFDPWSS